MQNTLHVATWEPGQWLQSLRCSQESQGKVETDHNVRSANAMWEATLPTADLGPQVILTLSFCKHCSIFGYWCPGGREEGKTGSREAGKKGRGRTDMLWTEWHFQLTAVPAEESRLVGEPWIADTIVFMHWGGLASANRVQKCTWLMWLPSLSHSGEFWPPLLLHFRTVKALFYPSGKVFLGTWTREFLQDQTQIWIKTFLQIFRIIQYFCIFSLFSNIQDNK